MPKMTDTDLAAYRRRHPELFTGELPSTSVAVVDVHASEAALQQEVVRELTSRGWTVWEGPKGSKGGGAIFYTDGVPDITAFKALRRIFWLELKQPGNGPTVKQLQRHAELRAAGFDVTVAWTLSEALALATQLEHV